MDQPNVISGNYKNFIFIGEAGSGKSEVAINAARYLYGNKGKPVDFFDMDMTKPLFRSRDVCRQLMASGITVHFEEQFMDAPTLASGVRRLMRSPDSYVVMDVGGDYIGARSIGGFSKEVNREDSFIGYVVNAFRPWSDSLDHIDRILGEILGVSHIRLQNIHIICNPNIGPDTNEEDIIRGFKQTVELITPYKEIEYLCVKEELYERLKPKVSVPVVPIRLYLTYPWADEKIWQV